MSHFVNSEVVFSVIGDYPITDQYDILYSNLQAGSTYDSYITGSLLVYNADKTGFSKGERGFVFSRLQVPQNQRPNLSFTTGSIGYFLQPLRERAGTIRFVKSFSTDERFYDSLTPSVQGMIRALGGDVITFDYTIPLHGATSGLGNHNAVVFDNDAFNPFHEISGLSPVGFEQSFPFEPKFSQVKRSRRAAESFVSKKLWTGEPPDYYAEISAFKKNKLLIVEFNSGSFFVNGTSFDANWWLGDLSYRFGLGIFGNATPETETAKILFGFGDRHSIKIKTFKDVNYVVGKRNLVQSRVDILNESNKLRFGPIVRGWKYGLIDANPHYSSCVFRRDRFGQFRDMLEQRLNSMFTHDEKNSPMNYLGDVERPAIPPADSSNVLIGAGALSLGAITNLPSIDTMINNSPVRVNFTRLSYIEATKQLIYYSEKPENTASSNLSSFATSSLPYFDDVSRNRNEIPARSIVLSSLYDLFGNATIGV
jgi:hypothetical protein